MSLIRAGQNRHFFISYNHRDTAWAEWIGRELEEHGYSVTIQKWDFKAGSNFVAEMHRGLTKAEHLVAVLSHHYFESKFALAESAAMFAQDPTGDYRRLIPVRVEEVAPEGLFTAITYIDLVGKDEAAARHALLEGLKTDRKPARPLAFPGRSPKLFPGTTDGHDQATVEFKMVLTGTISVEDKTQIEAIVAHLKKLSKDADLTLLKVEEGSLVLWLQCSREGFERLQRLSNVETLNILGFDVVELKGSDLGGAAFRAGAGPADPENQEIDRRLATSVRTEAPHMLGFAVRPSEPAWRLQFHTKAGRPFTDAEWSLEKEKLFGYFLDALAVPGDDMHINLSAYQEDKIMPLSLSRSSFGKVFAEQDCLLKHLTASLLHPDTLTGKEFWSRVGTLEGVLGGDRRLTLWQKVWIASDSATIQEKAAGEPFQHALPPGWEVRVDDWSAWVSECRMRVLCQTDYDALSRNAGVASGEVTRANADQEVCLGIFRETILPVLETEVNEGADFIPLRQVYFGVALAKWYRERLVVPGIHSYLLQEAKLRLKLAGVAEESSSSQEIGLGPEAPPWLTEGYEHYMDLLQDVFRCVREELPSLDGRRGRLEYYSGGIVLNRSDAW